MAISVSTSGSFDHIENFLERMKNGDPFKGFEHYGEIGRDALAGATPVDTRTTAQDWEYRVVHKNGRHSIIWNNTNFVDDVQIAVIIQYGHATGNGAWVEGIDYINPVIIPLFDQIVEEVWKEVTRA